MHPMIQSQQPQSQQPSQSRKEASEERQEDRTKEEELEEALRLERRLCQQLREELSREKRQNAQWKQAASSLVNVLLMSPKQNDAYASEVTKQLEKALTSLSVVESLRYVNCSFPATNAFAPAVELLTWNDLDNSEWLLSWCPAWSCEVVVDGRQVISFSTLLRLSGLKIQGRLKLAFSSDLSKISLRFAEMPAVNLDVTCQVIIGKVPLPIQETMGNLVRDGAIKWIRDNLVDPKQLTLTLNDKKKDITEDQFAQATKAALIGAARAKDAMPSSFLGRSLSR